MDTHYWLFPWLSLFASLIAAFGGLLLSGRSRDDSDPPPSISPILIVIWLASIGLMVLGGLKLGGWATVDYVPARGVLAGALGGVVLALVLRKHATNTAATAASVFGFSTALVCCSRLWLTHGEVSGLPAMAFSAGAALLCLVAAPAVIEGKERIIHLSAASLAFISALACGALLGFNRADTLNTAFWADIPLMIGASITVGLLIAASLNKYGSWAKSIAVSVSLLLVTAPLAVTVAHLLPVLGIVVLGAATAALALLLVTRVSSKELSICLGFILIVAGTTVAFTLLSGYGIALYTVGVVAVLAIACACGVSFPISWAAFSILLLVYRLEVLQNGSSVRAIGPGDIWDLIAVGLGILLPKVVTTWISDYKPRYAWSTSLQWLIAISLPTLVLDYIWQPRSLTGLFLGLAIGQLADTRADQSEQRDISGITALMAGLLLFLFLPGLDSLAGPSRAERVACVVALTVFAVVKVLTQRSNVEATTKAA